MLSLSRGGPTIWMSPQDAAAIGVRDNDWVEAVNRNGVLVAARDRQPPAARGHGVRLPRPGAGGERAGREATGKRGGIHNSLTRILVKPTHLIGGYAQLSFAFNYLGPTGNQRDEVTVSAVAARR